MSRDLKLTPFSVCMSVDVLIHHKNQCFLIERVAQCYCSSTSKHINLYNCFDCSDKPVCILLKIAEYHDYLIEVLCCCFSVHCGFTNRVE
jgi:hypothetical protein